VKHANKTFHLGVERRQIW